MQIEPVFVITIQWSQLPTKIMLMKQVETFSAVCSRLDSVKLDMFQALGLLVSTTPRSKRGKKEPFDHLSIFYFMIL